MHCGDVSFIRVLLCVIFLISKPSMLTTSVFQEALYLITELHFNDQVTKCSIKRTNIPSNIKKTKRFVEINI